MPHPRLYTVVGCVRHVEQASSRTDSGEESLRRVLAVNQSLLGDTGRHHVIQELVVTLRSCYSEVMSLEKE